MLKKTLTIITALVLAFALDINGFAQSETTVRPGGAIYDVSSGSYLGTTNYKTGAEETLASTIGSGLTATSVVCVNASKVLTSTCTSTTPSFGATTVTGLTATGAVSLSPASANVTLSPTGTGTVTINPAAVSNMDNMSIGFTTPKSAGFTTLGFFGSSSGGTQQSIWAEDGISASGDMRIGIGPFASTTISGLRIITNSTTSTTIEAGTHTAGGGFGAATTLALSPSAGATTIGGTLGVTGVTTLTAGLKGSVTNDTATAGNVGELLTTTVASGSAVSLTTATSANIATLSLTAGDWDCSAQVTHNAAATTSVTLLQIGISATTATLPTQAGGSGIGTDPLASFRQAAAVPGGALTTNVGPVRVSLSGTTNIFLVANDTFTVSTMTGYGTVRCRRMR